MCGFLGIALGIFVYISGLCSLKSFGVPYMSPFAPKSETEDSFYFLPPIWKREYRASFIYPKKARRQEKISMKWKFNENLYKNNNKSN